MRYSNILLSARKPIILQHELSKPHHYILSAVQNERQL